MRTLNREHSTMFEHFLNNEELRTLHTTKSIVHFCTFNMPSFVYTRSSNSMQSPKIYAKDVKCSWFKCPDTVSQLGSLNEVLL